MGKKDFITGDDIILTSELKIGSSTGSLKDRRTDSDSWVSNATYVPTTAHLHNKVEAGGPTAGPETKMATRKEQSSATLRSLNYQQMGNYSSIWFGHLNNRAEAFPMYIHQDIYIQGVTGGGRRLDDTYGVKAHNRYFVFYNVSGWSGTKRNYPYQRKGWMKVSVPSGTLNSFYNFNLFQLDSGSDSLTFDANGNNVSKFLLSKGHYWVVLVNDTDIYDTSNSPSSSIGFGLHASSTFMGEDAAWRGSYQATFGNTVGLISTATAWQPTTSSTFTPPATITTSNWSEWTSNDNASPGFWKSRIMFYGVDS